MEKWLASYERRRRSRNPKEPNGWISSRYHFQGHWREVQQTWVPELQMNVGSAISALHKSWTAYRIAGRYGEPRADLAYRINHLEDALGIEKFQFDELAEMGVYDEESTDQELSEDEVQLKAEEREDAGDWNLNFGTSEENSESSEIDRQLRREGS